MGLRMDVVPPARNRTVATVRTVGLVVGGVLAGALLAIVAIRYRMEAGTLRATLLPWWLFLCWGAGFLVAYALGLAYLLRTLRRHVAASEGLIDELTRANQNVQLAHRLGRTGTWSAAKGGPITWTGSASQLAGLDPAQSQISAEGFVDLIHPEDRERTIASFREALKSRGKLSTDFRFNSPDGIPRWLSVRGAVSEDQTRIAGTIVDVTRQMAAHEKLVDTEHQFRVLFEENPMPFCVYDAETLEILEVNRAVVEQFGYAREELLGMPIPAMAVPEQRQAVVEEVRAYAGKPHMEPRIWSAQGKDGSIRELRIHASAIRFRGRPSWLILAEDVTDQLAQQRELAYRATHDSVTGLLNGRALADRLQAQSDTPWRLAYVQLHGLQLIEDSLGQDMACRVMQRMAARFRAIAERYGEVGHIRSEECVLAVRRRGDWEDALALLQRELARPIAGDDSRQQLESWIGTADFPRDHPDAHEAIRLAGLAAHVARAEGRPIAAFEPEMTRQAGERLRMAARLHRALEHGEFELHFQEIRELRSGRIAGLEALLRWPQANGGYIDPNDFIGVAEDTGLIVPLGRWVLHEAARAQQRLQRAGFGELVVAINVSQAQFVKDDLVAAFEEVLQKFALPRGALHMEMTESILMSRPEQARAVLAALRARGVCVALDDFGTGFSSMAYLRQLPIDAIKLDRSFVHGVHRDERNAAICQALLTLAHRLELKVVAEGVEEQAEYEWLEAHDCDQAQGYCIARPAPLEAVLDTLAAQSPSHGSMMRTAWKDAGGRA